MSLIGCCRIGMVALGLVSSCATYSSLDGELQGDVTAQAGAGANHGGGSEGEAGSGQGGSEVMPASGGVGGGGATAATSGGMTPVGGTSNEGGGGDEASVPLQPTGLTLSEATTNIAREPNAGGTEYLERCAANEVLIGFHGTVDAPDGESYLRSAQAICGSLAVSATEPWEITVTETRTLTLHEVASTEAQTARCPANQVMVGFGGRSGLWMDSVDVRCAPLTILGMSPSFLLVAGTPSKAATIGGTSGGSPFDPLDCPAGSVAVGQLIRTIQDGVVLGAFGVQCATITLEIE